MLGKRYNRRQCLWLFLMAFEQLAFAFVPILPQTTFLHEQKRRTLSESCRTSRTACHLLIANSADVPTVADATATSLLQQQEQQHQHVNTMQETKMYQDLEQQPSFLYPDLVLAFQSSTGKSLAPAIDLQDHPLSTRGGASSSSAVLDENDLKQLDTMPGFRETGKIFPSKEVKELEKENVIDLLEAELSQMKIYDQLPSVIFYFVVFDFFFLSPALQQNSLERHELSESGGKMQKQFQWGILRMAVFTAITYGILKAIT